MKIGASAVALLVLHVDGHIVVNVVDVAGGSDLDALQDGLALKLRKVVRVKALRTLSDQTSLVCPR